MWQIRKPKDQITPEEVAELITQRQIGPLKTGSSA